MASVLLTAAGSALGAAVPGIGFLAGPALGLMGGQLGASLDASLGLTTARNAQGPRLENLRVLDSREGAPLPLIYGTLRSAGNIIWASDLLEHKQSQRSGGKGSSARVTTYSYTVHLAVGIAAGPIGAVHRIWADSKLIYDGTLNRSYADAVRIYPGDNSQTPDGLIESYLGSGNVPAYRGTAYAVIENLQLDAFGNRIPNLTFEVEGYSTGFAPAVQSQLAPGYFSAINSPPHRPLLAQGQTGPEIIIAGQMPDSGKYRFVIEHYSWRNDGLTLLARITSPQFNYTADLGIALAPDGRALFMASIYGPQSGTITLYDTVTRSFAPLQNLTFTGFTGLENDVAWLDNQTVVMKANDGATHGITQFRRAGQTLIQPTNADYIGLFTVPAHKWPLDRFCMPLGSTLLILNTDNNRAVLSGAQIQRQNGQISVKTLPDITLSAPTGATVYGSMRIIPLEDGFICLRTTSDGKIVAETLVVTASGFAITRPGVRLLVTGDTVMDAALATADKLLLISQNSGGTAYTLAEVTLTDSSLILTQDYTTASGSHTVGPDLPRLLRLSPYDFISMSVVGSSGTVHWISRGSSGRSLADITADLTLRAGLESGDLNVTAGAQSMVSGFAVTEPMSARRAAESLLAAYPFALAESDGTLRLTDLRSAPLTALPAALTRASRDGTLSPISRTRAERRRLPRALTLSYYDASQDYQSGSARAALDADPQASADVTSLPLVLQPADAQILAARLLASAQAEQLELNVTISRDWLALDAGDLFSWNGRNWRITKIQQQGSLLAITASGFDPSAVADLAVSRLISNALPRTDSPAASLYLLDLPALRDTDDTPGCYLAASAATDWPGGVVYDSNGIERARLSSPAAIGVATTALASSSPYYMDRTRTVTVALPDRSLTSCTELALLNGANLALLGSEIIQFQTATLIADQTWQLSNLLRGRYGTEGASHTVGERFMLLELDTLARLMLSLPDRGRTETLTLATLGQSVDDSLPLSVTYGLRNLQPFAPDVLKATKLTGSDLLISWQRRARINNGWADYIDTPLDEAVESYVIEIMNSGTVIRSTTVNTNSFTYTSALQIADFGNNVSSLSVRIAQVSPRYGRGNDAAATLTF